MKTFDYEDFVISYPQHEIEEIREALTPVGISVKLSKGKRINMINKEEKVCYILLSGYGSYRHRSNGFVISYVYSEHLIGVGALLVSQNASFFYAESDLELLRITENSFNETFKKNASLWKSLSYYMSYVCQRLIIRDVKLNTKNAYQVVKNLLIELQKQPDFVTKNMNAAKFILERAYISRSTVMDILSQLQKGGYITLKKGILISINKLPERF